MGSFDRSYLDAKLLLGRAVRNDRDVPQSLVGRLAALAEKATDFTPHDELELEACVGELMRANGFSSEGELQELRKQNQRKVWYDRLQLPSTAAALSVFCFLLILLIIRMTTDFNKLSLAVSDIKEATSNDYFDGIENTRVLVESAVDPKGNWQLSPDARTALKTARDLDGRLVASISSIHEFCLYSYQGRYWWSWVVADIGSLCDPSVQQAQVVSSTEDIVQSNAVQANLALSWQDAAKTNDLAIEGPLTTAGAALDNAAPASTPPPPAQPATVEAPQSTQSQATAARRMMDHISDFANTLGLTFNSAESNTSLYRVWRWAENTKSILGGSILPLLYGVLGSAVYLLRTRFSSEHAKTIQLSQSGGAFLRLGLGGISGLAIGWFWIPTGADGFGKITSLTPTPFAIAFLAGYSIDLLFSILDRLISAMNPRPERVQEGRGDELVSEFRG